MAGGLAVCDACVLDRYNFYWTEWFNSDDPLSAGADSELLHVTLQQTDVCKGVQRTR